MKNNSSVFFRLACLLLLVFIAFMFYRFQKKEKEESSESISIHNNAALSVIHSRKSVRNFVPGKLVSEEDIQKIVRAGMAAPSGRDLRPWEIIVINDRMAMDTLATQLPYAKMLETATLAIVVCGDTARSPLWVYDCSAVTQNILLAAEALGLGAVWTAAHPYEDRMSAVANAVGLPASVLPLAVIPVGYPNGDFEPKEKYDETKVHFNRWTTNAK
ncbi:MAG: nitroreductase family protein [Prevotellaceae bacterium]|jgi:nitroreductase|nr:nitroreductase family protein [Prevotellaceae bacterium]